MICPLLTLKIENFKRMVHEALKEAFLNLSQKQNLQQQQQSCKCFQNVVVYRKSV